MNLGQYIAQQLLEAGNKTTIALFPGAFKPPHKGHFEVVKQLLNKADEVVVLVSPKTRDGVDADESIAIWDLYKTILDGSVEIKLSEESPIREVYNIVKDNPDTDFILAAGKGEIDRFKSILQFPNVEIFDAGIAGEGVNATGLRNAIKINSKTEIEKYLPKGINTDDFINILEIQLPTLTEGRLTESQTGTIGEFIKFAAKNLGIQNLPGSLTLSYDNKQAQDKRTFGFFDPHDKKIWIYVKNRNMADILRTLAHELVHRKQEEDGKLDIKSGETGSPIEDEANAMAGVLLRNFGKINNSIYEHKKIIKLKNILKEAQQLSIGNSIIFGVEHHSESDAQAVVDYVKKRYSPEDKVVFMGEGGNDDNKYVAGSEQEMIYNDLNSYFNNLVNDSWDGSDLNVMNDQSLLYKIQKEKTGLSLSKILAANWASMVGQNILQNQSIADFAPEDYLSTEGIKFLKAAAQEAELPLSDNLYEPTSEDYNTLYRLSFPADYGDKYTKVAKVADAFNKARDENLLSKLKKYESRGYKVIVTAGEGHIDLIKAMLKK
jgi:cytidyltransferase-like protein